MATLDNANPTVLSAADLPTRQKRALLRQGPDSKYTNLILERPAYLSQAFGLGEALPSDESSADPIDEQEIFGTLRYPSREHNSGHEG